MAIQDGRYGTGGPLEGKFFILGADVIVDGSEFLKNLEHLTHEVVLQLGAGLSFLWKFGREKDMIDEEHALLGCLRAGRHDVEFQNDECSRDTNVIRGRSGENR